MIDLPYSIYYLAVIIAIFNQPFIHFPDIPITRNRISALFHIIKAAFRYLGLLAKLIGGFLYGLTVKLYISMYQGWRWCES